MSARPSATTSCSNNGKPSTGNDYLLCCYSTSTTMSHNHNHHQHSRGGPDSPTDSADSSSLTAQAAAVARAEYSGTNLCIASSLLALVSLAIIATAVSTGQWLLTEEKLPKLLHKTTTTAATATVASATTSSRSGNGTITTTRTSTSGRGQGARENSEPEVKYTYSGLWRVCVAKGTSVEYECSSIDYFPKEEYSPDPSDSTMAIPYAVTKSAVFFFTATALLVVAEVCFFAGQVNRPKPSLYIFAAGITFIISGLLMLVGMVMYISVFKAEVGSKLRPRSSFQGPPFVYRYGYSFLLYVSGFISTEFAGTTAIFLHISWQQLELAREFSKRKYPNNQRDGAYNHLDANHHHQHHQHHNNLHPHHHHHHHLNHLNHVHNHGYNHVVLPQSASCQPSPASSGGYLCERHQKRYFYDNEPTIGCHIHQLHSTHQHRHGGLDYEEYMAAGQPGLDCGHYHRHGMTHDLTTETVSTIADALQEEYGLQHEFVTFDLGDNLPPLPETVRNSGWKSNSFKKTTPV